MYKGKQPPDVGLIFYIRGLFRPCLNIGKERFPPGERLSRRSGDAVSGHSIWKKGRRVQRVCSRSWTRGGSWEIILSMSSNMALLVVPRRLASSTFSALPSKAGQGVLLSDFPLHFPASHI